VVLKIWNVSAPFEKIGRNVFGAYCSDLLRVLRCEYPVFACNCLAFLDLVIIRGYANRLKGWGLNKLY